MRPQEPCADSLSILAAPSWARDPGARGKVCEQSKAAPEAQAGEAWTRPACTHLHVPGRPGTALALPTARGHSCPAGPGSWEALREPRGPGLAWLSRCQRAVGGRGAGTLPCPLCPAGPAGTYLRRCSRPCLLEFLLRSAERLMLLAATRLDGDLA